MIVAELLRELAKLPADMPVVVAQDNEPVSATVSASGVEVLRMHRDTFWTDPEAWDFASRHRPDERDVDVCYIDTREPAPVVVDAEQPSAAVAPPAVEAPGAAQLIPGDVGYQGPWPTDMGPTWRQLIAASLPDLTPREAAVVAEVQRQADLVDDDQGDPLDPRGRCAMCGKPAMAELCTPCAVVFNPRAD